MRNDLFSSIFRKILSRFRPGLEIPVGRELHALRWYTTLGLRPLIRGFLLSFKFPRGSSPTFIGRKAKFIYPKYIRFGSGTKVGDFVTIVGLTRSGISIGNHVTISDFGILQGTSSPFNPGESLSIGGGTYIGPRCNIGVGGEIQIGNDCQIGSDFIAVAENHGRNKTGAPTLDFVTRKGIVIGDNCWIGHRVTIVDGVTIGRDSVIGAGTTVTKSFPANSIIVGSPGSAIKKSSA